MAERDAVAAERCTPPHPDPPQLGYGEDEDDIEMAASQLMPMLPHNLKQQAVEALAVAAEVRAVGQFDPSDGAESDALIAAGSRMIGDLLVVTDELCPRMPESYRPLSVFEEAYHAALAPAVDRLLGTPARQSALDPGALLMLVAWLRSYDEQAVLLNAREEPRFRHLAADALVECV